MRERVLKKQEGSSDWSSILAIGNPKRENAPVTQSGALAVAVMFAVVDMDHRERREETKQTLQSIREYDLFERDTVQWGDLISAAVAVCRAVNDPSIPNLEVGIPLKFLYEGKVVSPLHEASVVCTCSHDSSLLQLPLYTALEQMSEESLVVGRDDERHNDCIVFYAKRMPRVEEILKWVPEVVVLGEDQTIAEVSTSQFIGESATVIRA